MMERARTASIALVVAAQSAQLLAYGGVALFLPLIRGDLDLTFSQSGSLAVASAAVYALMQIPSGYFADRFGAKRVFLAGLLGNNALSCSFALLHSYHWLVVNQAASGFFRALVFAPGLVLISSHFPSQRRATAMSIYVAGGFSSTILLNSFGPFLVEPLGWRTLFLVFAIVGFVMTAAYWKIGESISAAARGATRHDLRDLAGLLRNAVVWLSGVVQFVRHAVVTAAAFWLPSYLVFDKALDLSAAGVVVAIGAVVSIPSIFLGGYVSDRLDRPLLVIGTSLTALATASILLVQATTFPLLVAVVVLQSIFIQLYFGPLFGVPIRFLGTRAVGTVSGFSNFCANLGGLTIAYTMGAVKDATGSFTAGFYALSALCGVGLIATVLLNRHPPATTISSTDARVDERPAPVRQHGD